MTTHDPRTSGPSISTLLRMLRQHAELTQEQLASHSGVAVRTIRRLEAGDIRTPRIETVRLLADALNLTDDQRARLVAAAHGELETTPASGPRQLPADVPGFTGRTAQLEQLDALLAGSIPATCVVISAIAGTAGVGKTALAVHFGHRVTERFPDGQLFIDLRGYAPGVPMSSTEALGQLLRGLGVPPDQIPASEQEQSAYYRSVLAGKRILVILDNAHRAGHVGQLLPGSPGCFVMITSRTTLAGVDAAHLDLDLLPHDDAITLLARLSDPDRVAAEPHAADTLVNLCARLPLAIRIAGARLAARPGWPVALLVELLADEQRRLDELRIADLAIRATFAVSHHALQASTDPVDRQAARAYHVLGALDCVDLTVPVAAALLDAPAHDVRAALERLVDDHLLETSSPARYHAHDLLRLYARDLAAQDKVERHAALLRAMHCYLAAAEQATRLVDPTATRRIRAYPTRDRDAGFVLHTAADVTAWVDTEHANLLVAAHHAVTAPAPAPAIAVRLGDALYRPMRIRGLWQDLIDLRELGARTAHRLGDKPGEALAEEDLASAYGLVGRAQEEIASSQRALSMWRDLGDRYGEQSCLHLLGNAYRTQQRPGEAKTCLEQALAIDRDLGYRHGEGVTFDALGLVRQHLHRLDDAIACHRQAIAIGRGIGNHRLVASALGNLGWAYHRAGHSDQAIASYEQSLLMARALGVRYLEAEILWGLGQTHHALGNCDRARTYWLHSIAILHNIGELTDEEAEILSKQPIPDTPAIIQRNT